MDRRSLFGAVGAGIALSLLASSARAQSGGALAAIRERGSIRVGVVQAEPWAFKDPLGSQWTGIAPSYARALAEALKVEVEFVEVTWGTAVAALQSGRIDIMPNLSVTPERALAVEYSNAPLSYSALALLVPGSDNRASWDEFNTPETRVALSQGSSEDYFVTRRLPKARIFRFGSYAEDIAALQNRTANAVALFHPTLVVLASRVPGSKITIPRPPRYSFSDTAVRREADKSLRDWLTTANSYFYNSGSNQEWYEAFLRSRNIDPATSPSLIKERW
jgi:polar amino acid transport system substrate-binding protein